MSNSSSRNWHTGYRTLFLLHAKQTQATVSAVNKPPPTWMDCRCSHPFTRFARHLQELGGGAGNGGLEGRGGRSVAAGEGRCAGLRGLRLKQAAPEIECSVSPEIYPYKIFFVMEVKAKRAWRRAFQLSTAESGCGDRARGCKCGRMRGRAKWRSGFESLLPASTPYPPFEHVWHEPAQCRAM